MVQGIGVRLRDGQGVTGGSTIVRGYMAQATLGARKMFVSLSIVQVMRKWTSASGSVGINQVISRSIFFFALGAPRDSLGA
jgi:hypothetical protein